ncbi:MAG: hemolysin family protein [Chitinophagaceae bacterium]|nr:hemolysin family protein [Chitinophagaceae bacterium]
MTEVFIILGLIVLNGLFSMAEIALLSARKARLEVQAQKGDARAKEALVLANNPDKFLSTVQIGITLMGILTGIFSGENLKGGIISFLNQFDFLRNNSGTIATIIVVIFITYLSLVGELIAKRVGLSKPEKFAKLVAAPMKVMSWITHPFIWLLSKSTNLISKIFNIRPNDSAVTEEEIKAIINEGTEHGAIEEAEQEIIERLFHLGDRNITSLMTHRSDIEWMEVNARVVDIKQRMREVVHSTYPLCEGSIDNIKGIISIKDILLAEDDKPLKDLMEPGMFVPENNSAYQVLERFKAAHTHSCFIVDEYGSLEGMITLNDILEAIVGDIAQEDSDDYSIVERSDGSYLIDAQIPFYDFLSHFNKTEWMNEGEHEFDTLAGFILHRLQRIPHTGDTFDWKGFKIEIIDMDSHRIDKVMITLSEEMKETMEL